MGKLLNTIRILSCLGMARHFGRYVHSTGGPREPEMAIYEWRGKRWAVPLTPIWDY